ncbi:MAG TPA: hypothetical protein PK413_10900 [Thermoanaerobaculia bacterium]|nr:hypothetical protein [Thermoanaerobaculia bacterium]
MRPQRVAVAAAAPTGGNAMLPSSRASKAAIHDATPAPTREPLIPEPDERPRPRPGSQGDRPSGAAAIEGRVQRQPDGSVDFALTLRSEGLSAPAAGQHSREAAPSPTPVPVPDPHIDMPVPSPSAPAVEATVTGRIAQRADGSVEVVFALRAALPPRPEPPGGGR